MYYTIFKVDLFRRMAKCYQNTDIAWMSQESISNWKNNNTPTLKITKSYSIHIIVHSIHSIERIQLENLHEGFFTREKTKKSIAQLEQYFKGQIPFVA